MAALRIYYAVLIYCYLLGAAGWPPPAGDATDCDWAGAGQLYKILLLVNYGGRPSPLADSVAAAGMACRTTDDLDALDDGLEAAPDAVLLDAYLDGAAARRSVELCRDRKLPVLAAIPREAVAAYDPALNPDEVVVCPVAADELALRIKQAVYRVNGPSGPQVLTIGELSIDQERYDVSVAGRRVALTYKEFQLLVLLASNPGRVYTREALLSNVWGYDYLGGTRTVDVHVRRLRSKIEAPGRSFVETIWNVGYRFKAPA